MIQVNGKQVDLLFQVEQDVPVNKLLNNFTLNDNVIMIVCPSVFFSNAIGDLYDYIVDDSLMHDVDLLSKECIEVKIKYKKKEFDLIFLVTPSEPKIINLPITGDKLYNVGFKKVQL